MKILHIIDSGGYYGAEVMLVELMSCQRDMDLDPGLCSLGGLGVAAKEIERKAQALGIPVDAVRMRNGPNLWGALRVLRKSVYSRVTVLHLHGYKAHVLFGLLPHALRKIPLVATLHGFTNTGSVNRMLLYEWANAKVLSSMDAVVAVSHGMLKNPRLKNLRKESLHVIPNGISICNGVTGPLDRDSIVTSFCQKGGYIIGSIGRLSAEKGYDHLIEALRILIRDGGDYRLVILGEGRRRPQLESAVGIAGLGDRVLLAGYHSDAGVYLPLFNSFVLPSTTEGMPISILEAMFAGVPIVASRVGGIPEMLQEGKGGRLVAPGDPAGLAAALRELAEDPGLAVRLAKESRAYAEENYSSRRMAGRYLEVYKAVLGN